MICRSARTESANAENLRISKVFGTDLVECIGNAVTCSVCAQYRGRVFSVSGNDKRYPPLRDGVNSPLKNGYDIIHPNCRCEFRAYFEALHSKEENEAKRKFSNRPFDGDKRTVEQAKAYQELQRLNRQAVEEQSRWNDMQALLGKDMPYKNMASFSKALRSPKDSIEYMKSHYAVRDYRQYQRWKNIVGEDKMPQNLADFQELKYNKTDDYCALKESVVNQSNSRAKSEWDNDLPPRGQLPYMSGNELYSFVEKELGVEKSIAIKYVNATVNYTDNSYSLVRAYQCGDEVTNPSIAKELSDNIENYIKKAPRWNGGETYRGCAVSFDKLQELQIGNSISMGGTSSWSDIEAVAYSFAKNNTSYSMRNMVIYHCPTQSKGTGIRHISIYEKESEVICSKESKYEIIRIEVTNNINHVYLKEE
ncbi:MAG: phage minor capsid protein [Clostridia bacterium]|nr:phage minor capsid protein [Clostridia bacterium]